MINDFRKRKLKLRPVTYLSGTHAYSNDIPHAYIWSPYLVPKPKGLYLVYYYTCLFEFQKPSFTGHVIAGKLTCNCFTDWGPKVDVVGFCFLDLASNYEPPEPLLRWLGSGDKPIYIGFGSLVSYCPPLKVMYFAAFTFCQSINGNCAFKLCFISI